MKGDWLPVRCPNCGGHGLREGFGGGPVECRSCGGAGGFYIYPNDRLALWPGGPLQGSWPGEYQRQKAASLPPPPQEPHDAS